MNRTRVTLITMLLLMGVIFMPSHVFAQSSISPEVGYWSLSLSEETFSSCVGTQTDRMDTFELYGQMDFTILLERDTPDLLVNRITLSRLDANDYIGTLSAEGADTVQMILSIEGSRDLSGKLIITYLDGDTWCSTTTPFSGVPQD